MRFTKMHGAGNDYVYVDCVRQPPPADPVALSQAISDRHFGVGSDGLILILPSERADVRMRMFNADGSEAEMCGNGVRCVGKYAHDHDLARKPRLSVETGRGVLALDLLIEGGVAHKVRVDMGEPILTAARIPTTLAGDPPCDVPLEVPGHGEFPVTCVSMGNPHCVTFVKEITDALVHVVGPKIERHACFPKRANVEFVRIHRANDVSVRVWERGSGETLACGTGACAVLVAGVLTKRLERRAVAHLLGGDLELEWSSDNGHVYLTGPAVEVFSGEWVEKSGQWPVATGQ